MPITRGSVISLFMSLMSFSKAILSSSVLPLPTRRTAIEFECPVRNETLRTNGAFTHLLVWMGCANNSMYFNGRVHTLSYQRSPSHPSVCVNAPLSCVDVVGATWYIRLKQRRESCLWRKLTTWLPSSELYASVLNGTSFTGRPICSSRTVPSQSRHFHSRCRSRRTYHPF